MKTHVKAAKEETGQCPPCTGALLEITRIRRDYVKAGESDWAKENAGCAQYIISYKVKEPKAAGGARATDRVIVGNPQDKEAVKKSTWEVSEGGPARMRRLLARSGTALVDDDEEWMADAAGRTVVCGPITHNAKGYVNLGLYYRESDKDAPVIGLTEDKKAGRRRPAEAEGEEGETAEEPEKDESEEAPKKPGKSKPAPEVDPDDDDDDDEPPAKPAKAPKKPAKPADDEDDD